MGGDDEFDDFLARRKPLFRRPDDVGLEPPPELDRIVLRQAEDAIRAEKPQRSFRGPLWGAPLAVAATLLIAFTVVLHVGMTNKQPLAEVRVQNISQEYEPAASPPPPPPAAARFAEDASPERALAARAARRDEAPAEAASGSVVVDLAAPAAAPRPALATARPAESAAAQAAPANAEWRRDARSWLAHIERLRAEGKSAEADAELSEYNRQNRAYAGAPDR